MSKARIIADYAGTGATTDLATQTELDAVSTVASAALPKAGGTMSGNIVMGDDTSIGIGDSAERIEFDGAGDISVLGADLGVGTTAPLELMDLTSTSANKARLAINQRFNDGATGMGVDFYRTYDTSGDDQLAGFIRIPRSGGNVNTGMQFAVGNQGTAPTAQMTIDTSGNVGIGIDSNTTYPLHIQKDTDNFTAKIENDGNSTSSDGLWVDTRWNTATNTLLKVTTNSGGTEVLTVKGDGNVGIGCTPYRVLDVMDNAAGITYPLRVYNDTADSAGEGVGIQFGCDVHGADGVGDEGKGALIYEPTTSFARGKFHFLQNTDANRDGPVIGDAVMTIANDGKVGIGTDDPTSPLHVVGNAKVTGLAYLSGGGGSISGIGSISVGTSAVDMDNSNDWGTISIVSGNGGGNIFTDLVFWCTTAGATVLSSKTISGVAAGRTYAVSSSKLTLAMASGTYTCACNSFRGSI